MGDRNIRKEEKKPKKKKTEERVYIPAEPYERPMMTEPELVKKKKKEK
jgi:hypothetical protein